MSFYGTDDDGLDDVRAEIAESRMFAPAKCVDGQCGGCVRCGYTDEAGPLDEDCHDGGDGIGHAVEFADEDTKPDGATWARTYERPARGKADVRVVGKGSNR